LRTPSNAAFYEHLLPGVFETAHELFADVGKVARSHMHPTTAQVRALGLKGSRVFALGADIDQRDERDSWNMDGATIFGRLHDVLCLREAKRAVPSEGGVKVSLLLGQEIDPW